LISMTLETAAQAICTDRRSRRAAGASRYRPGNRDRRRQDRGPCRGWRARYDIEKIDVCGRTITPGLVDIHTHGALGRTFTNPQRKRLRPSQMRTPGTASRHWSRRWRQRQSPTCSMPGIWPPVDARAAPGGAGAGHAPGKPVHQPGRKRARSTRPTSAGRRRQRGRAA